MQPVVPTPVGTAQVENTAALVLLECLRAMGDKRSNAVLEVLQGVARMEVERKYPQPALRFGHGRWRAYYHSHALSGSAVQEHGHFHLFVADESTGDDGWAHLAGLAMDLDGQPLRWFTTNLWVTAGHWAAASHLLAAADRLKPESEETLVTQWLAGMVRLYREDIEALLVMRDTAVAQAAQSRTEEEVLRDRDFYELGEISIDLTQALQRSLAG